MEHVTGNIAGSGNMSQGKYNEVAPEVDLAGVKVLYYLWVSSIQRYSWNQWVVQNRMFTGLYN